jgi:hypothetical protein
MASGCHKFRNEHLKSNYEENFSVVTGAFILRVSDSMKHEYQYQYSSPKLKNGTKFLYITVCSKKGRVCDCNIVCVSLR